MTILVTGASGFLGSRLVDRLVEAGREVVAVARRPIPHQLDGRLNVRWIHAELTKENLFRACPSEIEAVVHLAGATLGAGTDEKVFLGANEQLTVGVCQALADKADRFIAASSQVVYGDARSVAVTEDFPLDPLGSAYACSKVNCENWLRWFQSRYGGRYLALRFCGFIDGGGLIDYVIDRALAGLPIELYSRGTVRRDYLPSADGVEAIIGALDYQGPAGFLPVNIGSGDVLSAYEITTQICQELRSHSPIELRDKPAPLGDLVYSIERAVRLLGFSPTRLTSAVRDYAHARLERLREVRG